MVPGCNVNLQIFPEIQSNYCFPCMTASNMIYSYILLRVLTHIPVSVSYICDIHHFIVFIKRRLKSFLGQHFHFLIFRVSDVQYLTATGGRSVED